MKPFARINLSSAALRRGRGKCENVQLSSIQYPVSNIQYPLFNDGGANWILAVGYWIFAHFHKGYSHALVGSGSADYLWILSRTPTLAGDAKSELLAEARRRGYDMDKLIWVEQK